MKLTVHIDQAVWEREAIEVDIPDDTPPEEIERTVHDAIYDGNYVQLWSEIQNPVRGFDTIYEILIDEEIPSGE